MNSADVRRCALLGNCKVEGDAFAYGFEAAPEIREIDLQKIKLVVSGSVDCC